MKQYSLKVLFVIGFAFAVLAYADSGSNLNWDEVDMIRKGEIPTPSTSPTISVTPSVTPTRSLSPSISFSRSISFTNTATRTPSPTISDTPTISFTPTVTRTVTSSPSFSKSTSLSATVSPTISVTRTVTKTPTPTISDTPTISNTASVTRTVSSTPTVTRTPSPTISDTPTISNTASNTRTPSVTSTITPSVTSTVTPTRSVTSTPSVTPTISTTATASLTTGASSTNTASPTSTISVTSAVSITPSRSVSAGPSISSGASISPSQSFVAPISASATPSPQPRGCPSAPGLCNLTCINNAYEYIAVGYNPRVAGSYAVFRWTQQVLTNQDFAFPDNDPQTFTAAGDSFAPPFFCANDNPDPGTPSLPNGGQYYLGYASEVHSNQGGVGSVTFHNRDPNNEFEVIVRFEDHLLLTQDQMTSPFTPCDLVVSNWDNVTYQVQKPSGGNVVDSGVITCFLLKRCNSDYLYSCQVPCFQVPNGPGCISPSASETLLPVGVSRSPSASAFVFQTSQSGSSSFTPSSSTSPGTIIGDGGDGASGADGGNTQGGSASSVLSWINVLL